MRACQGIEDIGLVKHNITHNNVVLFATASWYLGFQVRDASTTQFRKRTPVRGSMPLVIIIALIPLKMCKIMKTRAQSTTTHGKQAAS